MAARGNQARRLSARSDRLDGETVFIDLKAMVNGDSDATQCNVDLLIMLHNKIEAHEIESENTAQLILEANQKSASLDTELKYLKKENKMLRHRLSQMMLQD